MGGLSDFLAGLNPAQARVVRDVMALGQPRPRFGPELAASLRAELEDRLAPLTEALPDPLWVTKRALGQVHTCEGHYLAEHDEAFGWNRHNAEGTVVHRALELSISARHRPAPLDLVDSAIASLLDDDHRTSPRPWLLTLDEVAMAGLRARVNDAVVKFRECWPPLPHAWSPRTETAIGADLCGGRIVLRGRVDLAMGMADGDQARCLIVDLKTGQFHSGHVDDLRFYALIQTLRIGVPPFRVAGYYLDSAEFQAEDVTADTLEIAVRRTADGVAKILRLAGDPSGARLTPGPTCRWCGRRDSCPEASVAP